MLILAFLSIGVANATDDGIDDYSEIRSPVISGSSNIVITPENFSGFWYDIDDNIVSESLTIYNIYGRTIEEDFLAYRSSIVQVEYEADFASEASSSTADTYPVISLFGDKYIPTSDDDAGELVNLLLDTDDKYTLRVSSPLELSNGYELTAVDIDVEGDKVLLELTKNGKFIDDEFIDITSGEATWDYDIDVGNQDDVIVFRALITDIFQGQVDNLVVIEGLWLMDYETIMEVGTSDEFGKLEVDSVSDSIVMLNHKPLALSKGETVDLAESLKFKVADDDDLRFYLMKECTESGTYELRGNVVTGPSSWTAQNFAGFMYNLDDNVGSETLTISNIYERTIDEGFLVYNTSIVQVDYEANFESENSSLYTDTYPVLSFFGEIYVSLSDATPSELVRLLVDSSDVHILRTSSSLDLSNGYKLTVKQIDLAADKVYMELSRDGAFIENEVVNVTAGEATWDYGTDVGNQDDVIVSRVHVTGVSEDDEGGFVIVDGLYLIDYQDIFSIGPSDEFGELIVDTMWDAGIQMYNSGPIVLNERDIIELAPTINLWVADNSDLRYYPFVEVDMGQNRLEIESFSPSTSITGYESESKLLEISLNQIANINWFIDGIYSQSNLSSICASYCTLPPSYGEHTVKMVASNENNSVVQEWEWIVQKDPVVAGGLDFRSPVISGLSGIVIAPENFSAFWYDFDDNFGSEVLTISSIEGRTIPEGELRYEPVIMQVEYEADFVSEDSSPTGDTYPIIGFFGDKYVPISDDDAGEFTCLLVDTDDKYTLRAGSILELPNGYELTVTQIDIDCDKVYLELSRNGELIGDEIIDITSGEATWDYKVDVGSQDGVIVFRVLVTDVFQGQIESLVIVEGLWLLNYEDIFEVETGDEFGKLEIDSVSDTLVMKNSESLTLTKDETVDLAEGMKFKVADDDDLRFYLMKECTESGTYELRGNVATDPSSWTTQNFAGFLYDLDDDIGSEALTIFDICGRTIEEDYLVYNTSIVQVDYEADFASEDSYIYTDTYPVLGLFGERYVSLSDGDASELVKLLVDSGDSHTLRAGSVLELSNGYELNATQIDVEAAKVWMELSKDGEFVGDKVIDVTVGEATWDYDADVGIHDEVIVSRVHVSEVSEDSEGSFVVVDGLYLIDYKDILSIESGDEFGKLIVDSVSDSIVMRNYGTIVLNAGYTIELVPGMNLRVADDSDLRYYPFVEVDIVQNYLEIESFSPSTTISGYESGSKLFEINLNQIANISWFIDGINVQLNSSSTNASYYTLPPSYGEHTIKALASNKNNSVVQEWKWTVQKNPKAVDSLELRSPVISSLSDIVITPEKFSGFWYDFDYGIGSENLTISNIAGRTIPKGELRYESAILQVEYEADFSSEDSSSTNYTYPVIGLFGDKYIPTSDDDTGELVQLLIDTDDKYTLRTGSPLELPNGYELTAKDIDVEGDKVYMELSKDGESIGEKTIDVTVGEATWDYDIDVGDQSEVIIFRCLVTDVFQGQIDSLVVVEGLWLLDYDNVLEIEPADEFGELKVNSISDTIVMTNYEPLNFSMGEIVHLAENLKFKVANDEDLCFYLMNECNEPGTYSLRGDVATGPFVWTAQNFAGFMYDLDNGISSESLTIFNNHGRVIDEALLVYNTSIAQMDYEASFASEDSPIYNDTYPALGLFGEKYVSLSDTDSGEIVKLLVDSNGNHVLRAGSVFELSNGYELTAKQIDVEGDKVWMKLSKDGVFIEDEVIDVTAGEETWDYDTDVGSQDDVIVSRVRVSEVSEDLQGSFVVIDGLYLIDYQDILSIEAGDEFGELEVDSVSDTIVMYNSGIILLGADDVIEIAPGLYLQVADDSELRYYPFIEYEIMKIVPNEKPIAVISSISPNPSKEGESVSFAGSGIDNDGTVIDYWWTSSIDGWLSDSSSFNTSDLSVGTHTIYFQVQDDDRAWSDKVSASVTVVDQILPLFMLTTSQHNNTHRKVSVTASEPIIGSPVVEVNSMLINVTLESDKWIGYFPIGADNLFTVNVTGTDLAGNIGGSSSVIRIETISYEDGQCKFNSSESGMSITFNGTNGTTGTMILTESEDPMVNLTNRSIGLYFLDVELDDILAGNMSDAMIAIPVDSFVLPEGIAKKDVLICYYNESTDNWDACPTSIEIIDGKECWTTYVTHFSMYGVIVSSGLKLYDGSITTGDGYQINNFVIDVTDAFPSADSASFYVYRNGVEVDNFLINEGDSYEFNFEDGSTIEVYLESVSNGTLPVVHIAIIIYDYSLSDVYKSGVVAGGHEYAVYTIPSDSVTSSGSSSGSSGGGGGGGTTGEKYENVFVKEVESIFVNKDSHISYEFNEEGNAISSVEFDSLKNSGTISTIIEVLKNRSSFAYIDAPGTIYQQMNIWVGKSGFVNSDNVENLMVTFRVEKSWLEENNIEASTVRLYRYSDGSWNALPTSITEEDADFVYFKSQTPGFSPFAIGSEAEVTETVEDIQKSVSDVILDDISTEDTETEPESDSFTGILMMIGGISVLLVGVFIAYKKRS